MNFLGGDGTIQTITTGKQKNRSKKPTKKKQKTNRAEPQISLLRAVSGFLAPPGDVIGEAVALAAAESPFARQGPCLVSVTRGWHSRAICWRGLRVYGFPRGARLARGIGLGRATRTQYPRRGR